jgi:hypothetical protein
MIELAAALARVEEVAAALRPRRVPLMAAVGRTLVAAIEAAGDSPPWDRAMMDGFAVRNADLAADGTAILDVVVDLAAGDVEGVAFDSARGELRRCRQVRACAAQPAAMDGGHTAPAVRAARAARGPPERAQTAADVNQGVSPVQVLMYKT